MEKEQKKEKDKIYWAKLIISILFVTSIIILFSVKKANPDKDITFLIVLAIVLGIAGIVAFFGKSIYESTKNKEEKLEPIGLKEINERINNYREEKLWNNLKVQNGIQAINVRNINKNVIYAFKVNLVLDDESIIYIINATYPNIEPRILNPDATNYEINKAMNDMSLEPEKSDEEERTETDLNTGKQTHYKKRSYKKKDENKKEEKVV